MPDSIHIHEDDLELYFARHLEPERIPALEAHLSDCQTCRERLCQCIGPDLEDILEPHRDTFPRVRWGSK